MAVIKTLKKAPSTASGNGRVQKHNFILTIDGFDGEAILGKIVLPEHAMNGKFIRVELDSENAYENRMAISARAVTEEKAVADLVKRREMAKEHGMEIPAKDRSALIPGMQIVVTEAQFSAEGKGETPETPYQVKGRDVRVSNHDTDIPLGQVVAYSKKDANGVETHDIVVRDFYLEEAKTAKSLDEMAETLHGVAESGIGSFGFIAVPLNEDGKVNPNAGLVVVNSCLNREGAKSVQEIKEAVLRDAKSMDVEGVYANSGFVFMPFKNLRASDYVSERDTREMVFLSKRGKNYPYASHLSANVYSAETTSGNKLVRVNSVIDVGMNPFIDPVAKMIEATGLELAADHSMESDADASAGAEDGPKLD